MSLDGSGSLFRGRISSTIVTKTKLGVIGVWWPTNWAELDAEDEEANSLRSDRMGPQTRMFGRDIEHPGLPMSKESPPGLPAGYGQD